MNGKLFLDMIYDLAAASEYEVDVLIDHWEIESTRKLIEWEEFKERALRHEL